MANAKLTRRLADEVQMAPPEDLLEVVVELRQPPESETPATRAAAIAHRRQSFEEAAEPIEALVRELGGAPLERAWISRSLRALVPAQQIERLAQLEEVALLDRTKAIESDSF
jgi:hypothetical protein